MTFCDRVYWWDTAWANLCKEKFCLRKHRLKSSCTNSNVQLTLTATVKFCSQVTTTTNLIQNNDGGQSVHHKKQKRTSQKIKCEALQGTFGKLTMATDRSNEQPVIIKRLNSIYSKNDGVPSYWLPEIVHSLSLAKLNSWYLSLPSQICFIEQQNHPFSGNNSQIISAASMTGGVLLHSCIWNNKPKGSNEIDCRMAIVTHQLPFNLATILAAGHMRTLLQFWHVAERLLRCISHMHKQGIVHRDIKPENIFGDDKPENSVVLGDWGSSRWFSANKDHHVNEAFFNSVTSYRQFDTIKEMTEFVQTTHFPTCNILSNPVTSYGYHCPEMLSPPYYKYDKNCDIWSLGCVFVDCLFLKSRMVCPMPSNMAEKTIGKQRQYMNEFVAQSDDSLLKQIVLDGSLEDKRRAIVLLRKMMQITPSLREPTDTLYNFVVQQLTYSSNTPIYDHLKVREEIAASFAKFINSDLVTATIQTLQIDTKIKDWFWPCFLDLHRLTWKTKVSPQAAWEVVKHMLAIFWCDLSARNLLKEFIGRKTAQLCDEYSNLSIADAHTQAKIIVMRDSWIGCNILYYKYHRNEMSFAILSKNLSSPGRFPGSEIYCKALSLDDILAAEQVAITQFPMSVLPLLCSKFII